jgi:hypothetical protein
MKQALMKAGSQEQLILAKAQVQMLIKNIVPEVKSQSVRLVQTRLVEIVLRDEETQRKLECSIDAMKSLGKNTSHIDEKLGDLSVKVMFAKDDLRNAELYSQEGNYSLADYKTISAQSKLEECYVEIKDIVKEIKANNGAIVDCVSSAPGVVVVAEENASAI